LGPGGDHLDNVFSASEIRYLKFLSFIFQNGIRRFARQVANVRDEIWKCSQNCLDVTGLSGVEDWDVISEMNRA